MRVKVAADESEGAAEDAEAGGASVPNREVAALVVVALIVGVGVLGRIS